MTFGALADYIEARTQPGAPARRSRRFTAAEPPRSTAGDLTLDKFIDAQTLATATSLPLPSQECAHVLLTGATGLLGRFLALEWLERMIPSGGKLICLVRGNDDADARQQRLDEIVRQR